MINVNRSCPVWRANHLVGQTAEKEDVSGTITVPEVAHDTELHEYVVRLLVPAGRGRP